jgi:hypothetical protein
LYLIITTPLPPLPALAAGEEQPVFPPPPPPLLVVPSPAFLSIDGLAAGAEVAPTPPVPQGEAAPPAA